MASGRLEHASPQRFGMRMLVYGICTILASLAVSVYLPTESGLMDVDPFHEMATYLGYGGLLFLGIGVAALLNA